MKPAGTKNIYSGKEKTNSLANMERESFVIGPMREVGKRIARSTKQSSQSSQSCVITVRGPILEPERNSAESCTKLYP